MTQADIDRIFSSLEKLQARVERLSIAVVVLSLAVGSDLARQLVFF
jgi:hypothetical protein